MKLESGVKFRHRLLNLGLTNHARHPNRRCRDHLDVDVVVRKSLEHGGRNSRVGLHTSPNKADSSDCVVGHNAGRAERPENRVDRPKGCLNLIMGHSEADIGMTLRRHVLHDHVDVDISSRQCAKQQRRHTGTVNNPRDGHLRLAGVVRYRRYECTFHGTLLGYPGTGNPRECAAHMQLHSVGPGQLN